MSMTMLRRFALALVAVLAAALPSAAAAEPNYVALGDSYVAGPIIPLQIQPWGCLKSNNNYAHLAAPDIGLALRDPSCSGAETEDMTQTQGVSPRPNPPQFDKLGADTEVVTLGIGGNDIGFSSLAEDCFNAGMEDRTGSPCKDMYTAGGTDQISQRIAETAPKVAANLQGIRTRSPNARVYVVNYPAIFPDEGPGCYALLPVADGDVVWLREKQKELNQMLADQAAANGATLVDWYSASIGHDACRLPGIRWVEPAVPANAAAPVHPNLLGMMGGAEVLTAVVNGG
jgi:hypothetical protein